MLQYRDHAFAAPDGVWPPVEALKAVAEANGVHEEPEQTGAAAIILRSCRHAVLLNPCKAGRVAWRCTKGVGECSMLSFACVSACLTTHCHTNA